MKKIYRLKLCALLMLCALFCDAYAHAQATYAQPLHGLKVNLAGGAIASLEEIEVWPARQFDPAVHHVFPILVREINSSENLKQNKGY